MDLNTQFILFGTFLLLFFTTKVTMSPTFQKSNWLFTYFYHLTQSDPFHYKQPTATPSKQPNLDLTPGNPIAAQIVVHYSLQKLISFHTHSSFSSCLQPKLQLQFSMNSLLLVQPSFISYMKWNEDDWISLVMKS